MSRILIAEDEDRISSFVAQGLRADGHATTVVADGASALDYVRTGEFDLMILDLGLPIRDGLSVLEEMRGAGIGIPVIVLTARDSTADAVRGLESGADDYVRKPFAFDELRARVRTRLKPDTASAATTMLVCGALELDLRTRRVSVDGRTVDLTPREFSITEAFARHPDQVLSRQQLLSGVWGFDFDVESNIIDVYVRALRRKLGDDRIETVRGMGYRMRASP